MRPLLYYNWPMPANKLSVIVISYNTKSIKKNCLKSVYDSLASTHLPFEVIVIDNVSKDGSLTMFKAFKKEHSNFTLIKKKENVGFARENNQAAKKATGE